MRLTRIFVADALPENGEFVLSPEAANHLVRSMRLRDGQEFAAFDGSGVECRAVLRWQQSDRRAWGIVRERSFPQVEMTRRLILYLAVVKGERFDWAVEKATELGAARIVPLLTEFTAVRSVGKERLERWRRLAESAAAQSGRVVVPGIAEPLDFKDALRSVGDKAVIFAPSAPQLDGEIISAGSSWSLFVGPEGGFSESELTLARKNGVLEVGLGARILRVETAAVAALCLFGALE